MRGNADQKNSEYGHFSRSSFSNHPITDLFATRALTREAQTSQNGQTHSNHFVELARKGLSDVHILRTDTFPKSYCPAMTWPQNL